eukprot:PDM64451.1 hypothetical protein PRIPAC_52707 [Pristionchus pacificus]
MGTLRPHTDTTYKVTRDSLASFLHEMNVLSFIDDLSAERPTGIDRLNLSSLEESCRALESAVSPPSLPPLDSSKEGRKTPGRAKLQLPPPSPRSMELRESNAMEVDPSPRISGYASGASVHSRLD